MSCTATPGGGVAHRAPLRSTPAASVPRDRRVRRWHMLLVGLSFLVATSCGKSDTTIVGLDRDIGPSLASASIKVVAGEAQDGEVGSILSDPLVVEVTDSSGAPFPAAPVLWSFAQGGGSQGAGQGPPSTVVQTTTGQDGRAEIYWQLGAKAGMQTATAEIVLPASGSAAAGSAQSSAPAQDRAKRVGWSARGKPASAESVTVSPSAATLSPGDSVQLVARVTDKYGNVLDGPSVLWASTNDVVAEVTEGGLVRAMSAGPATVQATSGSAQGTTSVTVEGTAIANQPPTATISSPSQDAVIKAGGSVTFAGTAGDADGTVVSHRWSFGDGTTATVEDPGPHPYPNAGTYDVAYWVIDDLGASSAVATRRITVESVPTTVGAECASPRPEWIWCDDFEQDRLNSYFEVNDGGGSFVRAAGVGKDGSLGMRARWSQGQVTVGWLHLGIGRSPDGSGGYRRSVGPSNEDFRELYWRFYVRTQPDWVGGGGYKLSRAMIFHSPDNWGQAMIAHVWAEGDRVTLDPASGTDTAGVPQTVDYNDFPNLRWLGLANSATPIFDASHVGQWYCVEAHVRLNDAGVSNGTFDLWIDDQLEAQRTGLNWVGSYDDYGLNDVMLENYWNGGSPAAQERYMDNFVVSRERIGC